MEYDLEERTFEFAKQVRFLQLVRTEDETTRAKLIQESKELLCIFSSIIQKSE